MFKSLKLKFYLFYKQVINFFYSKYKNVVNKIAYNRRKKKYLSEYNKNFKNRLYVLNLFKRVEALPSVYDFGKKETQELIENAKHINKVKRKSPFFYDADIIEIHNESAVPSSDELNKIKEKNNIDADKMLIDNENILKYLIDNKNKTLWEKLFGKHSKMPNK